MQCIDAAYCYVCCSVCLSVCLCVGHTLLVNCAKTAELIDIPFVWHTCVSQWNHILDGDPDPQEKGHF